MIYNANPLITSGQHLCELLVSYARRSSTEAMYPPCILDLTDRVLNHLAEDGDMEDFIEGGPLAVPPASERGFKGHF